uniref:PTM/DIR17-like Tudor domain-containing protein n=1 Tax=Aegilops tauschii subsp. strangulata TaxID=200361 RepID=A0A453RC63_AEGTS
HDSSSKDLVGRRIKVWWPLDKEFYPGVVESYDSAKKLHTVLYDDGDMEQLNMAKEKWKMIESNGSPMKQQKKDHVGSNQGRVTPYRAQETKSTSSTKVPANQHKSVKTAQETKSTSSTKVPANQHKSMKTPSPLKRKGKPKTPPENKRRKTSGGSKSIEATSEAGVNDSDSASSLAHSDSDKDVKSDGEKDKEVAVGSAEKEKTGKTEKESAEDMELEEKKPDGDSLSCKEESDDETLSVWKKRASQAT